jgi:hypothetical protein
MNDHGLIQRCRAAFKHEIIIRGTNAAKGAALQAWLKERGFIQLGMAGDHFILSASEPWNVGEYRVYVNDDTAAMLIKLAWAGL